MQASLRRTAAALAPRNVGALYMWVVLILIFSIISPDVFARPDTVKQVLNEYAVTGLIALGLLMPLCAGLYDLSIGSVAGLAGITSAWFLANVSANPVLAVLVGLLAGMLVGVINIVVVLVMRVDSFIGTLATSSIATAVVVALSGANTIVKNVNGSFSQWLGVKNVLGLTMPVGFMIVAMLILGYLLERTAFGRHVYATGYELEVARLGGIRVNRLRGITLLMSSGLAGLAGIAVTGSLGAGDPTIGPSYLLPAFAAAFLGATQFRHGRFNPWGAVVAVLLLGTGDVGLLVVGAPSWSPQIFNGALLITAVALTSAQGFNPLRALRRRIGRSATTSPPGVELSPPQLAEQEAVHTGSTPAAR